MIVKSRLCIIHWINGLPTTRNIPAPWCNASRKETLPLTSCCNCSIFSAIARYVPRPKDAEGGTRCRGREAEHVKRRR